MAELHQLPRDRSAVSNGRGPREALGALGLEGKNQTELADWIEDARLAAILGGCRLSMPSVSSGVRCYIAFVGTRAEPGTRHAVLCTALLCRKSSAHI